MFGYWQAGENIFASKSKTHNKNLDLSRVKYTTAAVNIAFVRKAIPELKTKKLN
jgi:hypothetical protein